MCKMFRYPKGRDRHERSELFVYSFLKVLKVADSIGKNIVRITNLFPFPGKK